jgi:hypothetical protein
MPAAVAIQFPDALTAFKEIRVFNELAISP